MANRFDPDYACRPGDVLVEQMESHGIDSMQLSKVTGLTIFEIDAIKSGAGIIDAKIAASFEKLFGLRAEVWLGIERDYRERQRLLFHVKRGWRRLKLWSRDLLTTLGKYASRLREALFS